jgi:hypothetical protein
MAKNAPKTLPTDTTSADAPTLAGLERAERVLESHRIPTRRVLMVKRRVTVALGQNSFTFNGGDLVVETDRVAAWEHDEEHFRALDVLADHVHELTEERDRAVADLRRSAESLGYEIFPIGAVDHRKLRR